MHSGSGSIISSRSSFTHTGSPRPARPGQLDPALADSLASDVDPERLSEISHTTAWALLNHVHTTNDPAVVERVLTLVDHEGVDVIAELWSHAEPGSLPGVLWRLYLLRTWMRKQRDSIAHLWRLGEPVATSASAIAGVDPAPTEDDIARIADAILAGAFRGDFAVALERAAAFVTIVSLGLRAQAHQFTQRADSSGVGISLSNADIKQLRTQAAQMLHTAANLTVTAKDFRHGAALWRQGKLE